MIIQSFRKRYSGSYKSASARSTNECAWHNPEDWQVSNGSLPREVCYFRSYRRWSIEAGAVSAEMCRVAQQEFRIAPRQS